MRTMTFSFFLFCAASAAHAQASLGEARLKTAGADVASAVSWTVEQGTATGITDAGAADYDYVIDGIGGVTAKNRDAFLSRGNSLTVRNGGRLTIQSDAPGGNFTKNVTIPNGVVSNGTLAVSGGFGCTYSFKSPIRFEGVSTLDRSSGAYTHRYLFDTDASISGSGTLYLKRADTGNGGYDITVNSDNNAYAGQVVLSTAASLATFVLNKPLGEGASYKLEDGGNAAWSFAIADGALEGASRLTFNRANASTSISGASVTLPTLEGTGGTISASGTLTVNQAEDGVLNSALTGSFALVKEGEGRLTLGGDSSFTGGLTVNAGEMTLTSANAIGAGPLTLNAGGAFGLGPARPATLTATAPATVYLAVSTAELSEAPKILLPNVIEATPGDLTFESADGYAYEFELNGSQLWLIGPKATSGEARLKTNNASVANAASWAVDQGQAAGIFTPEAMSYDYVISNNLVGAFDLSTNNGTFTSQANSLTVKNGGVLSFRHTSGANPSGRYYANIPNLTFDNATLRFAATGGTTSYTELKTPVAFKGNCVVNRASNASFSQHFYFKNAVLGDADATLTLTRSGSGGSGALFYLDGTGSDYRGEFILGEANYGGSTAPTLNFNQPVGAALLKVNNTGNCAWTVNVAAGVCNALRGIQVVAGPAAFTFAGANTLPSIDFGANTVGAWKGSATLTLNQTQDGTFGATLEGGLNLIKQGSAALTVTGAITTTGAVTVNEGTLAFADGVTVNAGSVVVGGTLAYGGASGSAALTVLAGSTLQPRTLADALTVASVALPEEGSVALAIDESLLHPEGQKLYFLKTAVLTGGAPADVFTGIPPKCTLGADETGLYVIKPPQGIVITVY